MNGPPINAPTPTAIIVGEEPRKVVTIARSLHAHGVRVIVAVQADHHLSVSSRAIDSVVNIGGNVADSAQVLCMVAESQGANWVVPTSDSSIQIVCAAYERLSRVCVPGCPAPHIVERVLDKQQTLAAAARCGVPVPVTRTIRDGVELESLLSELRFPIVAKPGDKGSISEHTFKTRRFNSADELRGVFAFQPRFGQGLIFQTYHGGQGVGIEVLMAKGEIVAAFQHRRLSENPPTGGVAVVAVSEPVDPALLEYSSRLLRALEWDGVAMVEFRHDRSTDDAALMEVNGRFWGSLPLAVAAGVDFPLYAWQVSQNQAPSVPAGYRNGVRVRWTAGALKRFAHIFAEDEERLPKWAATRQLLSDFRPGTRSAMWSWADPAPAIQEVTAVLAEWLKGSVKAGIRAIVPASVLSIAKDARMLPLERRGTYARRRFARLTGRERNAVLPRVVNSVLFVCHGNIMRSASAAQFLRDDLEAAGVTGVKVASAGTHARNGRAADQRVKNVALSLGANLDTHRATLLNAELVREYDVIFAMDEFNYVNVLRSFPESRNKLMLFGGVNAMGVYQPHEIADPYLSGQAGVSSTIGVVRDYVAALAVAVARRRGMSATSVQV